VQDTAISFETEAPDTAAMAERITATLADHAWIVCEQEGRVLGYAYAGPHKSRAAYRWACEVSVYVDRSERGLGVGRELYAELLHRLTTAGFTTAVAGMTLPNDASAALHRALGFVPVGVYRRIGYKLGAWHDVAWVQKQLG
jgi:L-amino acid N-acyltransferase YncA